MDPQIDHDVEKKNSERSVLNESAPAEVDVPENDERMESALSTTDQEPGATDSTVGGGLAPSPNDGCDIKAKELAEQDVHVSNASRIFDLNTSGDAGNDVQKTAENILSSSESPAIEEKWGVKVGGVLWMCQ